MNKKTILIVGAGFVGKSDIVEALAKSKESGVVIVNPEQLEMSEQDVQKRMEALDEYMSRKEKMTMEIHAPLPLPDISYSFLEKEKKPWKKPPGKGKKFYDKHNFKKR